MTGPPTVPGRDLNTGPLSFEASARLTELNNIKCLWMISGFNQVFYLLLQTSKSRHILINFQYPESVYVSM